MLAYIDASSCAFSLYDICVQNLSERPHELNFRPRLYNLSRDLSTSSGFGANPVNVRQPSERTIIE